MLLLAIPLHIDYFYDNQAGPKSQMRLIWLFGLVRIRLKPSTKKKRSKVEKKGAKVIGGPQVKEKRTIHQLPGKKRKSGKVLLALITSEGLLRRVLKLLYKILSIAKIKQLQASVRFGLDDPAETGLVYGLLTPAFSLLYAYPRVDFVATPVFDRVGIETNIQTQIRVVPFNYFKAVLLFIFTKESLRAARAAIRVYYS